MSEASERLERAIRNEELWTIFHKEIRAVLDERRLLVEACEAAKVYDAAIRNTLVAGQFERLQDGTGIATGHDLDRLYDAWISKVRTALP